MSDILARILPQRTWAMAQVGDIVSTFNGDRVVTDIKNNRHGDRVVTLDNGTVLDAFRPDLITIRRPLAKTRRSGVKLSDRVSDASLVNAQLAYFRAEQ